LKRILLDSQSYKGEPETGFDLAMLLLTFPELKKEQGAVKEALKSMDANEEVMKTWGELVAQKIVEAEEDAEFD